MHELWTYLRAIFTKWQGMVTGGLIAVYLAVQPFSNLPAASKKVFWCALLVAFFWASYRVWRAERLLVTQLDERLAAQQQWLLSAEEPHVDLFVQWPEGAPLEPPLRLVARNKGKTVLTRYRLKTLRFGLWSVSFAEVPQLVPDIDQEITYSIAGARAEDASDLLDLLMVHTHDIAPVDFQLVAEAEKLNGQKRQLRYVLTYASLHNRRRDPNAREPERCLTIERQ